MPFEPILPGAMVVVPLAGFAINGALALAGKRGKLAPSIVGPGTITLAFGIALLNALRLIAAEPAHPAVVTYFSWLAAGSVRVDAAILYDSLASVMALVVTGVGLLIHVYSIGYMGEDPGYARYFAFLNLFIFFMLVLVLGASFPVLFVGWEGVGLCSYLLIGFWFGDREKAAAGRKAFTVNRIGDAGFLVALFLLFVRLHTLDFLEAFRRAPVSLSYGGAAVTVITLFLFLGATGKSAQIPLYIWLPDAMAGPTPVSALIHAATMVTAGIYMVARTSVLFALAPVSMIVVAGVGAATALFAASIALCQYDIKKVLAYSTVSQLGYMVLGVGVGAYTAGVFHLVTQAFFKALLFLGAGAVIHSLHQSFHDTGSTWDAQDMRNMGGLRRALPITWLTMWVGTLAIAGVWPFAGFFSKDEILWQTAAHAVGPFRMWFQLDWLLALAAAVLTAVYMTRLMVLTFHGRTRLPGPERRQLREVPPVMWIPLVLLAVLSATGGWLNVSEALRRAPVLGWLPASGWLQRFLAPTTAAADRIQAAHLPPPAEAGVSGGGEVFWAGVSLALALAAGASAFAVLVRIAYGPAVEAGAAPTGLRRLLYRKWYVDEIYDALVVRPLLQASRWLWRWVDQALVDGAVTGLARGLVRLGWVGSRLQTGSVNTYAFAIVLGAIVLLALLRLL